MTTQRSSFIDSAIALAAATAFLYCVSTAYFGGYFGKLQLDENLLDRNFQQSLYKGFLIALNPVSFVLPIYAAVRLFYAYFLLPGFNNLLRHRLWLILKKSVEQNSAA